MKSSESSVYFILKSLFKLVTFQELQFSAASGHHLQCSAEDNL